MRNNIIDLHIHTTNSDGTKTPQEVLVESERLGLRAISITDHESCGAYPIENPDIYTGKIIRGIELKTTCNKREIELLGYCYNLESMKKLLPKLYSSKENINLLYLDAILSKFDECELRLPKNVKSLYTDFTQQPAKFISKLLLQYEEEKDYNLGILFSDKIPHEKTEGLYRGWISNPNSKFFVEFNAYPKYEDTIDLIKSCDGKVFIPHIFQYKDMSIGILEKLLSSKLIDGIECYYPTFSEEQTIFLKNKCKEFNLLMSGGSDYHGANKKNQLGRGLDNNLYIPPNSVDWIFS